MGIRKTNIQIRIYQHTGKTRLKSPKIPPKTTQTPAAACTFQSMVSQPYGAYNSL